MCRQVFFDLLRSQCICTDTIAIIVHLKKTEHFHGTLPLPWVPRDTIKSLAIISLSAVTIKIPTFNKEDLLFLTGYCKRCPCTPVEVSFNCLHLLGIICNTCIFSEALKEYAIAIHVAKPSHPLSMKKRAVYVYTERCATLLQVFAVLGASFFF